MHVNMMLCDHAAVADGKLYISGGGWNLIGPDPVPFGVAMTIDVPWDRANTPVTLELKLMGEDGEPVMVAGPVGQTNIAVQGEFEVGRPPGMTHGTPISVPLAFMLGPIPLPPGRRFRWELSLGGDTQEDWHLAFTTRDQPPAQGTTYVVDQPEG